MATPSTATSSSGDTFATKSRVRLYEQDYCKPLFLNGQSRRRLNPLMNAFITRVDTGTLLPKDMNVLPLYEAFDAASEAYGASVPDKYQEVRIGAQTFRNTEGEFLLRPLDFIPKQQQVAIEAQKIKTQLDEMAAWISFAQALFKTHWVGKDEEKAAIVADLLHARRKMAEYKRMDPQRIAELAVEYALGSRELLRLVDPMRLDANRTTGLFWDTEKGTLHLPMGPPFLTHRYSEIDLVKTNIYPLIEVFLDHLRKNEKPAFGDAQLISLAERYEKALDEHYNRIPLDRTGIQITRRGCFFKQYKEGEAENEGKWIEKNEPDNIIVLPTTKMPLVEQVFLQEWKLQTRLPLERAKHDLAADVFFHHYRADDAVKKAVFTDWIWIEKKLRNDEKHGPRDLAIRMMAFAHADPDKKFGKYAELEKLDLSWESELERLEILSGNE